MRLRVILCSLLPALALAGEEPESAYLPTGEYRRMKMTGFVVLVNPEADRHPALRDTALAELRKQLSAVAAVVPRDRLDLIRRTRIWVEWSAKPGGAAEHHPSEGWLRANGYNPDKAGDVEINNLRHFLDWSRKTQPCMVLHELAHALHHLTRKENHPRIVAAFEKAMEEGLYDAVRHANGTRQKAYAATNPMEYFAELTEAYFGKNDFEPFNRKELKRHDPEGYQMIREVWGVPGSGATGQESDRGADSLPTPDFWKAEGEGPQPPVISTTTEAGSAGATSEP